MLISCEKCSTTYVLDDALIPPQGAPVQCTRCGHVFTARLAPAEATPPRPAPAWENPELANRPANSTLVFGAGSAGRAPPPAGPAASNHPVSQTMMFGTPAVQARAAPGTPAEGPVPSQTLVFGGGAGPAPAAPRPNQTIAFGSPALHPPAPGSSNQTVIFGTPAGNQAPAATPVISTPSKTLPFGGSGETPGNRTVIFGMPGAPGSSPQPSGPSNQTLVFGAATDAPPGGAEAPRNQTMMFGRVSGKGTPKVTVGSAESAGYAAGDDPPSESTVRVDLEALAAGTEGLTDDSPQVRRDRTALFAMQDGAAPAPPASDERHNRTVLFAMNPGEPAPAAAAPPVNQTMIFGGRQPAAPAPGELDVGSIQPGGDDQRNTTAPELPRLQGQALELPPEDAFSRSLAERAEREEASAEADDAELARMRAAANRRTTVAVIVFLVLALALAAALAWYLFGRALMGGSQAAIEAQARDAVALLRRDDDAAHREAITRARALLQKAPASVEAQSALVLGTALAADDASARARRDHDETEALRHRLDGLSERSPDRPRLTDQLGHLREAHQRSSAEAEVLQGSLKQETQRLLEMAQAQKLPTAQQLAALRARSISLAVQGEVTSLALAEEFNQKSGERDTWADLALPEYVANGGSSYDEALRQLEAVELRDDTFLRAYVLSARISLIRKDRPGAEAQLAKVLAFHPGHDAALQLLAWVRSHRESD